MKGVEQSDKSKSIKKVTVLGQEISEDLLKKMNFAETRKFCLTIESDLRKFVNNPSMSFYQTSELDNEKRFLLYNISRLFNLRYRKSEPNEKGMVSVCFMKDPYMNKIPVHTLEEMHAEYMKESAQQLIKKQPERTLSGTDQCKDKPTKKAASMGNFKLLRRPESNDKDPINPTESTKEEGAKARDIEIDPETKKKMYENIRAKLFSPEELKSCDLCEDPEEKKPAEPAKEEYDLDYDRYLPVFLAQNAVGGIDQNPYYGQSAIPQYNPYIPPPGYMGVDPYQGMGAYYAHPSNMTAGQQYYQNGPYGPQYNPHP